MTNKPTSIRVFFAIPVSEDRAEQFQKRLLMANPKLTHQVRWTKSGNHHITVRFLGNIEEEKIPMLIKLVGESIREIDPFKVTLRYITPFPGHLGRLASINILPSIELQTLYNAINSAANHLDFDDETRAYMPHITLFKTKNKQQVEFQKIFLENESVEVNKLILYQSITSDKGSQYKILHQFTLEINE